MLVVAIHSFIYSSTYLLLYKPETRKESGALGTACEQCSTEAAQTRRTQFSKPLAWRICSAFVHISTWHSTSYTSGLWDTQNRLTVPQKVHHNKPCSAAIPPLDTHPGEMKTGLHVDTCTQTFVAALFRELNEPKYPPTRDAWMKHGTYGGSCWP